MSIRATLLAALRQYQGDDLERMEARAEAWHRAGRQLDTRDKLYLMELRMTRAKVEAARQWVVEHEVDES